MSIENTGMDKGWDDYCEKMDEEREYGGSHHDWVMGTFDSVSEQSRSRYSDDDYESDGPNANEED